MRIADIAEPRIPLPCPRVHRCCFDCHTRSCRRHAIRRVAVPLQDALAQLSPIPRVLHQRRRKLLRGDGSGLWLCRLWLCGLWLGLFCLREAGIGIPITPPIAPVFSNWAAI